MLVHKLPGKALHGSRTTCISVFTSARSPDIYMQFLLLVKMVSSHNAQRGILEGNTASSQSASEK